jgi:hypothetical protein
MPLCQYDYLLKLSLFLHRYGDAVEYQDIYLRAPDLPKDDIVRALVVPGRAWKGAGAETLADGLLWLG